LQITYFLPIFKDNNASTVLQNFKTSLFYKSNANTSNFVFVCGEEDKNLDVLKQEVNLNSNNTLVTISKNDFTYNDAFYCGLTYLNGEVVLLLDPYLARNDAVCQKCLEKFSKGVNVVHIVKRKQGFKGFLTKIWQGIYNFFIKIFTGKTDRCNVTSLGLIDKDVIDILKALPNKCCFLKNTKQLYGVNSRTIYIDAKTNTYKLNYKRKTTSLTATIISLFVSLFLLGFLLGFDLGFTKFIVSLNITVILLIVLGLVVSLLLFQKHLFDVRNNETPNISTCYKVYEVNKTNDEKEEKSKKELKQKDKEKTTKTLNEKTINEDTTKENTTKENKIDTKTKTKKLAEKDKENKPAKSKSTNSKTNNKTNK